MLLTEQWPIDAFQASAAVAFNVGELAETLDFISAELPVTVGGSRGESFFTSSSTSPSTNVGNTTYARSGGTCGVFLGFNASINAWRAAS